MESEELVVQAEMLIKAQKAGMEIEFPLPVPIADTMTVQQIVAVMDDVASAAIDELKKRGYGGVEKKTGKSGGKKRNDASYYIDEAAGLIRIFPPYLRGREGFQEFEDALTKVCASSGAGWGKLDKDQALGAGWLSHHYHIPEVAINDFKKSPYFSGYTPVEDVLALRCIDSKNQERMLDRINALYKKKFSGLQFTEEDYGSDLFNRIVSNQNSLIKGRFLKYDDFKAVATEYAQKRLEQSRGEDSDEHPE